MVLTRSRAAGLPPPGGCHSQVVQVVPWNVPILSHPMVHAAECHEVTIIQTQVKSFFQRLDVVYLQFLIKARNSKHLVTSLITGSTQMEISTDYPLSFFLPGIGLTECGRLTVPVLRRFRFLGTHISLRMNPAAIFT